MERKEKREEYAIILDFLPNGDPTKNINAPVAYAIGEKYFILLLLEVKKGVNVNIFEKVYIGEKVRDKIKTILRRVGIKDLSLLAKSNLEKAIEMIIDNDEKRFVDIFNKAGPFNIRYHTLEFFPGIGKSTLREILEERSKEPFKSLKDIEDRVKGLKNVKKIIIERILKELEDPNEIKILTG